MIFLYVLAALAGYMILSYVWGAINYKRGCGMDSLAFVCAPLLLPLATWELLGRLRYRVFRA